MARGRNRGDGAGNQQSTSNNNQQSTANNNNQQTIVLKVYLHCQECANSVHKCLRNFQGVQEVNMNLKDHTVTVKGNKDIDPKKLAERLQNKRNKLVEIVSPKPKEKKNGKQENKSQSKIVRVILSIYIHCENCGKTIMRNIQKMAGVQLVEMNVKALQVTVKGEFDPKKLVEYVEKQMGKQTSIVKTETVSGASQQERQQRQQRADNENNNRNTSTQVEGNGSSQEPGSLDFQYAAELLSDENSQACVIM